MTLAVRNEGQLPLLFSVISLDWLSMVYLPVKGTFGDHGQNYNILMVKGNLVKYCFRYET